MTLPNDKRRQLLKSCLALPLVNTGLLNHTLASMRSMSKPFVLPENIQNVLFKLYGHQANHIKPTNKLMISTQAVPENHTSVPIRILGEKGLVMSFALVTNSNAQPLLHTCNLSSFVDLPMRIRVKLFKSGEIFLVAKTTAGLIGVKQSIKFYRGGDSCS